jgi:hypothetical protein
MTRAEQIDFCTPIHLTFHQLELCDLTFGLTVRPWLDDRGLNGVVIRDDALSERAKWTVDRGGDPWIEVGRFCWRMISWKRSTKSRASSNGGTLCAILAIIDAWSLGT